MIVLSTMKYLLPGTINLDKSYIYELVHGLLFSRCFSFDNTDINTPLTSPSGNMHGMPLGYFLGEDGFENGKVRFFIKCILFPSQSSITCLNIVFFFNM